jgi:hypothetical protein
MISNETPYRHEGKFTLVTVRNVKTLETKAAKIYWLCNVDLFVLEESTGRH